MTHAKTTRILLPALVIAALIIATSARPTEAGSFGLSLNLGNTSFNIGIGEPSAPVAPEIVATPVPYRDFAPAPPAPRPVQIAPPHHAPGIARPGATAPRPNFNPKQGKAPNKPIAVNNPQITQRANPGQRAQQNIIVRGAAPTQVQPQAQRPAPGGPRR
ncbi:MAG: hypothetical protein Q4G03_02215 [Planctomycetia bacterium]|nr:hypothetical protein [Planctomycetia bacterium]